MRVRSLSSSVLRWPNRAEVEGALARWAEREGTRRPELRKVGYFGSYARGNEGVGSDLDLVIIVERSVLAPDRRATEWDLRALPVPADLIVFTSSEWRSLLREERRFARTLRSETIWVYERGRDDRGTG